MKVCILGNNLYPVYSGGGLQALALATEFRRLGHSVFFVSKRYDGLPEYDRLRDIEVYRVKYENVSYRSVLQLLRQIAAMARLLLRLRDRYDVVLFFNPDGGFLHAWVVLPLLHLLGKKTATRMTLLDGSDPARLARKGFSRLRLLPYRLHHRVISISTALSLSYESVFGRDPRLVRITNGVDTRRFRPVQSDERQVECRALGLDPSLRYCTFVGRIGYRKGVDILIEAWREVAPRFPDTRLLLVGPRREDYRQAHEAEFIGDLENRIRKYRLGETVVWAGKSDNVETYLRASDVFLFASRREGCPNALLEAMASGLPIVTTRMENITDDLITPDQEGLVTAEDPAAFAEALARVLTSPALASELGARARQRVEAEFSIGRTAERYLEILGNL
jgi:glycosyltransferase involved in cell wall biosynthesis